MGRKKWSLINHWNENPSFRAATKIGVYIAIFFFLIGLFLQPIIMPKIEYYLMPEKELELNIAKIYTLDTVPNWLLKTDALFLFQGCQARALVFTHNLNIPEDIKNEEFLYMYTTTERKACENCTYYYLAIFNRGKDILDDLTFSVNLSDDFILDQSDSKIEIFQQKNIPQRNNFLIKVDGGIKGNKSEILYFRGHTTNYAELYVNCDNIIKSKCYILRYDEGDIRNQTSINDFFNSLRIPLPNYDEKNLKMYLFNFKDHKFEEYNTIKIDYLYFGEGICSRKGSVEIPNLIKY